MSFLNSSAIVSIVGRGALEPLSRSGKEIQQKRQATGITSSGFIVSFRREDCLPVGRMPPYFSLSDIATTSGDLRNFATCAVRYLTAETSLSMLAVVIA